VYGTLVAHKKCQQQQRKKVKQRTDERCEKWKRKIFGAEASKIDLN
jgi:hypothetical protein